jgi:hypothetical protein
MPAPSHVRLNGLLHHLRPSPAAAADSTNGIDRSFKLEYSDSTSRPESTSPTPWTVTVPRPWMLPRCSGPRDLTASAHLRTLEQEDIEFFKEHGFLIKKAQLDPVKVAEAMATVWDVLERKALQTVPGITGENFQHSISPGISRDDPASWVGASANHDGKHAGGLRSLGHLDFMRELVPYDPSVRAMATAMLGPLRDSRRVRGVYPIFPGNDDHLKQGASRGPEPVSTSELAPHCDGQVDQPGINPIVPLGKQLLDMVGKMV